uniref:Vesicle-associated membrane protein/synaptobrevin-binding protein n=1 Tax=Cajanus cajan TaxID=3821 RepID=A0A151S9R3_CAJCA|nr:Vesicle-associated membrane protein/synaptobrevin-binding protein [Cajanus cajan]
MTASVANSFITVNPDELRFQFELEKQTYCDLKVLNNTENYVAFKVKTTSPKKYFVRPNTGVIHPWDSCIIRVTLQAQQEYPPNMQCKDKFLLQSTVVAPNTDVDDLPPDTFSKGEKSIEDLKLRVLYISPSSPHGSIEDDPDSSQTIQRLKEEKDAAVLQTRQLQQELVIKLHISCEQQLTTHYLTSSNTLSTDEFHGGSVSLIRKYGTKFIVDKKIILRVIFLWKIQQKGEGKEE